MSQLTEQGEPGPEPPRQAPSTDATVLMRYDANKKSAAVAYLLWFLLGALGAHRFYLRNAASGALLLVVTLACVVVAVVSLGFLVFLFVVPAAWLVVDAFLIPGKVRRFNTRLIEELSASALE